MSFLSATLLLGTLAAGIPVALHLLARQPPRRVVFPSVQFLQRRLTTHTSRLKVRRWWLLALRILALVAFAVLLARPHIDATMSSQWTTLGLIAVAGVGLFAMASVALIRGLARTLAWSLLAAGAIALVVAGIGAVGTLATGTAPDLRIDQPLALAIVIDNSPSSAWRVENDLLDESDAPTLADEDVVTGTRLAVAIARAGELISRLPRGSRVAILDRSSVPAGFSLDNTAARTRLTRLSAVADPVSLTDRMASAVELLRTSDLTNRHLVVVSDMSETTWQTAMPTSLARSPLAPAKHEDVPISVLNIHETARFAIEENAEPDSGEPQSITSSNTWISPPVVADVAPSPGVAIPIRFDIGVWSGDNTSDSGAVNGSGSDNGTGNSMPEQSLPKTATVQLSLYERDPALPVVRDGSVVLPPLRRVDRASIDLATSLNNRATEVILTLPPLDRGTHHAVVEIIGGDRFAWDNQRYITVNLPTPPRVLIAGDNRDEVQILAAALTAPHPPGDPAASYAIETAAYVDLVAVDWKRFQIVLLIDPPWGTGSFVNGSPTLDAIADVVKRGGGLFVGLGPNVNLNGIGKTQSSDMVERTSAEELLPGLVRSWRIPSPGTFWQVGAGSHPIFSSIMRPASMPNWSDFRVNRYWQTDTAGASDWEILARYAGSGTADRGADDSGGNHAAVMTRSLGNGRIAVTTTPMPALGPTTRTWNDLFGAADAWPAFMTVRGIAAYLAGVDRNPTTILTGQTAVVTLGRSSNTTSAEVSLPADSETENAPATLQLYAPQQPTSRAISMSAPDASLESGSLASGSLAFGSSSVVLDEVDVSGTYFLRAPNVWSGVSANLSPQWSTGETTSMNALQTWFGEENWSIDDQLESMSLEGGAGGSSVVSLHGPLTLLALIVFLAEQVLSNRFYGASRSKGSV